MNKYMHTINGRPAMFAGDQICFADDGAPLSQLLVDSLREIRRQQRLSAEYRQRKGFQVPLYDYLRIKVNK